MRESTKWPLAQTINSEVLQACG